MMNEFELQFSDANANASMQTKVACARVIENKQSSGDANKLVGTAPSTAGSVSPPNLEFPHVIIFKIYPFSPRQKSAVGYLQKISINQGSTEMAK